MKAILTKSIIAISVLLCITLAPPSVHANVRELAVKDKSERNVRALGTSAKPEVEKTTCTANGFCFFKSDDGYNQWCTTPQTPML